MEKEETSPRPSPFTSPAAETTSENVPGSSSVNVTPRGPREPMRISSGGAATRGDETAPKDDERGPPVHDLLLPRNVDPSVLPGGDCIARSRPRGVIPHKELLSSSWRIPSRHIIRNGCKADFPIPSRTRCSISVDTSADLCVPPNAGSRLAGATPDAHNGSMNAILSATGEQPHAHSLRRSRLRPGRRLRRLAIHALWLHSRMSEMQSYRQAPAPPPLPMAPPWTGSRGSGAAPRPGASSAHVLVTRGDVGGEGSPDSRAAPAAAGAPPARFTIGMRASRPPSSAASATPSTRRPSLPSSTRCSTGPSRRRGIATGSRPTRPSSSWARPTRKPGRAARTRGAASSPTAASSGSRRTSRRGCSTRRPRPGDLGPRSRRPDRGRGGWTVQGHLGRRAEPPPARTS